MQERKGSILEKKAWKRHEKLTLQKRGKYPAALEEGILSDDIHRIFDRPTLEYRSNLWQTSISDLL
jgi:hypothetical protein